MSLTDVILLGAGRGTAELLSLIRDACRTDPGAGWHVVGILDDAPGLHGNAVDGTTVLGSLADVSRFPRAAFLCGIANSRDPSVRLRIARRVDLPDDRWATFVHPTAFVADNAVVAPGTIVYPHCAISAGARIGPHCAMYYGATIHHDSHVGEGCCLCASVLLAGHVSVGPGCYLGMGAKIRQRVCLGLGVIVGMGAVVTQDVPDGQTVVGVPARPMDRPNASEKARP